MKHTLVRAQKEDLKKYLGWTLAMDVTEHLSQDWIDEDSGEVTRIERNLPVAWKGTVLTRDMIEKIDRSQVYAVAVY